MSLIKETSEQKPEKGRENKRNIFSKYIFTFDPVQTAGI